MWLMGYFMVKHNYSPAGVLLGIILGPIAEDGLRDTLIIGGDSPIMFVLTRPISLALLVAIGLALFVSAKPKGWETAAEEDPETPAEEQPEGGTN